ncbi:MAG: sugar phosphate isomerase/epimerase, partial [Armatimonadetes bacterium]|nr:sugar phosphate isomerase/epimerase [Armatimonadota bacterium]
MSLPIIMHVNYCEQGQTYPEMCRKAVAWGYDGIEFRSMRRGTGRRPWEPTGEPPEEYIEEIARSAEDAGLKHVLFGGPGINLSSPDPEVRKKEIERGLHFYKAAAERVKLTVCNVGGGGIPKKDPNAPSWDYRAVGSGAADEEHFQWCAEGFRQLGALAVKYGFKMAFETHMGGLTDLPEPTKKLLDMIGSPAVGANLDYGNMVYFTKAPTLEEAVSTLAGRIYMVHLKNSQQVGRGGDGPSVVARFATSLADGVINNREFLRLLKATGFDGALCIEAPRAGDREWFAREDIA